MPLLEVMAKSEPNNAQVLYKLGISHGELGQFDEAIIRLKRAVQIDPSHGHAWTGIGVAYERMGKRDQALEALQQAVKVAPDDGYAQLNLGGVLMSLGRTAEALPHDPRATFGLAAALVKIGRDDDAGEADELFTVVIERWPGSTLADHAREARTKTAQKNLRGAVGGGLRPDVMMYITSALDTFEKVGPAKVRDIAFEVAMKGQSGLDVNDSDQKYTLKTLPGKFSGLHLVAIMYAGFKQLDPDLDAGIDFQAEYDAARALRRSTR